MKRIVLIFFLFLSEPSGAEMLVAGIDGDARSISVERAGAAIPIKPLTLLEAGDRIRVADVETRLVLVGADGKELIINKHNSPFPIPQSETPSWPDNTVRLALRWYRGLTEQQEIVIAVITRSNDEQQPTLLGMSVDENLVPVGMPVHVFWSGGKGPYRVELESGGNIIKRIDRVERPAPVAVGDLAEGRYRIRIIDVSAAEKTSDEQAFEMIARETLPPVVRNILASGLAQSVRLRIAAAKLAGYPEWRFTALQYAAGAGDTMLEQALLVGLRPDMP